MSYSGRFPPVAGFVSQAQLVFGSRVIQTAEGAGRLTEVSWNHQGAHSPAGGGAGQLGKRRRRTRVSQRCCTNINVSSEEVTRGHVRIQVKEPSLMVCPCPWKIVATCDCIDKVCPSRQSCSCHRSESLLLFQTLGRLCG